MMTRKTAIGIGVAILAVLIVALVLHYPKSVADVMPADQPDLATVEVKTPPKDPRLVNSDKPGFTVKNRRPNSNAPSAADGLVAGPSDLENAREAKEMNDPGPGNLPPEVIREAVDEIKPFIRACYEETLVDFPDASGRVTLEFDLEAEDSVIRPAQAQVYESGTTLSDEQMTECIVKAIGELEIKGPSGANGTVKVRYPFNFSPRSSKEVE